MLCAAARALVLLSVLLHAYGDLLFRLLCAVSPEHEQVWRKSCLVVQELPCHTRAEGHSRILGPESSVGCPLASCSCLAIVRSKLTQSDACRTWDVFFSHCVTHSEKSGQWGNCLKQAAQILRVSCCQNSPPVMHQEKDLDI